MVELARNPYAIKRSRERVSLAHRIKAIRKFEKASTYKINRDANAYEEHLRGFKHFLKYLENIGGNILDIGAGQSIALAEALDEYGIQLPIIATCLLYPPQNPNLKNGRIILTSGELLNGIPNSSIAGAIALHSIGYSQHQKRIAERLDEVLKPGAPIKATFRNMAGEPESTRLFFDKTGFQPPDEFSATLKNLGYDITFYSTINHTILLAVKPNGTNNISAKELMDKDRAEYIQSGRRASYNSQFSPLNIRY